MQEINHSIFKQKLPTGMQLEIIGQKIFYQHFSYYDHHPHIYQICIVINVCVWMVFLGVFQTLLVLFLF